VVEDDVYFMQSGAAAESENERGVFVTTRWSMVLSVGDSAGKEGKGRDALSELCRTYWRPIFSFVCWRGHSPEDAQDLTQDFFVMIFRNNWFERADPTRGRFRSFLLKSLTNFLNNAAERNHAQKRGGDLKFISWDEWIASAPSQISLPDKAPESLSPELLFDLRWAATVTEQTLRRLREECESKGRLRLFEILSTYLTGERSDASYADLSAKLGIPESAVKKQLHNMRQRYRWLLRDEVAHTVENPAEVDDEIRYLCAALAAATA
jgi:RNA polymerase sigma-70 factor (ECF subfamily)